MRIAPAQRKPRDRVADAPDSSAATVRWASTETPARPQREERESFVPAFRRTRTGDLADYASDAEYEQVRELLAPLRGPLYVLPGNHDDRHALHRHFGVPGADGEPVQYAADLGPLRLVAIDTTRPGEDPGALDAERLGWLDEELATAPKTPTLLAMHHPPLPTGVPAWDELGLPDADRQALGEVIARHPHVRRIVAGHVHRTITGELAGRPVLKVPSTYVQSRLEFGSREIELADEPAGFAVHAVLDGEVVSHVQPVK